MRYFDDITTMNGGDAEAVDVVIGGSPCQDLSVAGQRAGLDGERSSLFFDQIRVIKEAHRKYGRNKPRYMVFENVPGALSSSGGEDFRRVLEETARIVDETAVIPRPEKGKWTTAGAIVGDDYSVAWRVLNAQFFGVPQRRRRLTLIADFGGQSAPKILFKSESVSGDIAESGETRERATGSAESGIRETGNGVECLTPWDCQSKRIYAQDGCMATLQAMDSGGANNSAIYDARGNGDGETVPTITGDHANRITDYTAVCCEPSRNTVRRLTPLESERLQGYPDGWTDIGEWTDSKGKKHKTTDTARYKALGNSIALPPWRFVCRRISEQYDRPPTMGSLFDGIGGFPLIWREINGADSVPWVCEIDEYCKAVTRRRFT